MLTQEASPDPFGASPEVKEMGKNGSEGLMSL
jgi:hypothetical protein